ncbi:CDP-diacylglycerol--glycerol-3-phosphate 3-phosphatidyltransferase 1, chloroplastic [Phalaenopsis equestris]|uniref:CDP-diacylglycerol--glycerol-3-phosphate 3-phosphatidyltransferase 1, chloroplastic n=1 Tax=Phalaenopsis equestris TaxID=78828 RepID=UPI0009E50578|nr:CDP-diacylglycerol--glycerol-3-phosphate 3-phosphatidyltransferase 1, chloroplastic [Phalaenopsis equestris]
MFIVKTLISRLRNHNCRSSLYFQSYTHFFCLPSPFHLPRSIPPSTFFIPPFPRFISRLPSPRSSLVSPLSGWPPFPVVQPAWKLSQSATPLYLRGREAIFPSDLFRERVFPIGLGSSAVGDVRYVEGRKNHADAERVGVDERWLNLPNLISISRMVSGPVIGWMIMNEWYIYAFCGLSLSGATDWLDGFIARKMNINSVVGSYLDPLADKILIGCVAVAMVKKDLINSGLVGLVILRDIALVSGAIFTRASNLGWQWKSWSDFVNLDDAHREKVEPLLISKVNTVFQLLLVAAALLQPELGNEESKMYITYLSWLVASTTAASFTAYIKQYRLRRALA